VGVSRGVGVGVGVGVAVGVAVGVGVGVGAAQGLVGQLKISISPAGVVGSYPPANQMLFVPSVSVGKLRRAFVNGMPTDQLLLTGS
jgi:hypothetical protein